MVYALKFVLHAEGPRDYVDLLLSMKHQPNIVIIDMAHMVAAHGNIRKPGMFSPFEGRLAAATEANIQAAQQKRLKVDMSWLMDCYSAQPMATSGATADHTYHTPIHPLTGMSYHSSFDHCRVNMYVSGILFIQTGSSHHYCLFDILHEGNTERKEEILRRIGIVPQWLVFSILRLKNSYTGDL